MLCSFLIGCLICLVLCKLNLFLLFSVLLIFGLTDGLTG